MKKRFLILPLLTIAGLSLTGCGDDKKPDPGDVTDYSKVDGCDEVEGHSMVTSKPSNGDEFYLGYLWQYENMRFTNGKPHSDAKGDYPFYLGTDELEDDFSGFSTVEVCENDDGETFRLKMHKEGAPHDNLYIGVYMATSSYDKDVYSIHMGASGVTGLDTFTVESGSGKKTETNVMVYYDFSWCDIYLDYKISAPVVYIQDDRAGDQEAYPKFLGSGVNPKDGSGYISIDCQGESKALAEEYNIAHFYEM